MIVRKRERLSAAAASKIDPMRRETRLERVVNHASRVAGVARPFESVDQNQLRARIFGALRMDANLHFGLGLIIDGFDRPARFALRPRPEISGDGRKMRVPEERYEGPQVNIVVLKSRCA